MKIKKILKTVGINGKDFFSGVIKGHWLFIFLVPFWMLLLIIFTSSKDIDDCISEGKVWDYYKDYCRADCLLWNKTIGCVQFSEKMMKQLNNCLDDDCRNSVLSSFTEELCLKYKLPYDKERNQCFWDFTPELCHKLSGNWQYPKICDK